MGANLLPREVIEERLAAVRKHGSVIAAAKALGISRGALTNTVQRYPAGAPEPEVTHPDFPDDDISGREIIEHHAKRFAQREAHHNAKAWFPVKVHDPKPIGVVWVGDPHLGNNGTNAPLVLKHADLMASTPGVYAINIGDTVDNWGGRLTRLYAENDVSRQTERKLARWFLQESGIKWLVWLHGNHDQMDGAFTTYLEAINGQRVVMSDWRAQFRIVLPDGEFRIDAAHNFKGHSLWNEMHGPLRAAKLETDAEILVAGHHHTWGVVRMEGRGGQLVTLLRVRGYKWIDDYALKNQFESRQHAASIMTVLDAKAPPTGRVRVFEDIEEGAAFLAYARKKSA